MEIGRYSWFGYSSLVITVFWALHSTIEMKDTSKQYTLNSRDWKAALKRGLLFLAPLALIYINQVTGAIQQSGHSITLFDFIPSAFTWGAVSLYVLNRITDLINRFISGK